MTTNNYGPKDYPPTAVLEGTAMS